MSSLTAFLIPLHQWMFVKSHFAYSGLLKPGESTTVQSGTFRMHKGMDGPHNFPVHLKTNNPNHPDLVVNCYPIRFPKTDREARFDKNKAISSDTLVLISESTTNCRL
jgi:hypothetical protein